MREPFPLGMILGGSETDIHAARSRFLRQPVDQEWPPSPDPDPAWNRVATLGREVSVTGPGTYYGRAQRTLIFTPSSEPGWWIERTDLPEALPIQVSVRNVWTSQRNIVLRSGSPHNYLRMVEHIVALRLGMGIDNLIVKTDSGDPPLFDRSSMDLVEAFERAGRVTTEADAPFVTVTRPVTLGGSRGDFLTLLPAKPGDTTLHLDVAIDFPTIIGQQRIRFDVTPDSFRHGAAARTNATFGTMLFTKTVGQLLAETRNLGYTRRNILIHSKQKYLNEPGLLHNGQSLEAAWHRATLDLLAAIALVDTGRFVGTAISYRAGHTLDVRMMTLLYKHGLLASP
jgi:UDP-3-O-acyl-N-acetylglucosamine deacetylase